MKEVSVIAVAKSREELKPLISALKKQSFQGFELVTSQKKGIPQALNDAISRAKGKILVITESDAMPLTNTWLEEMVEAVKRHGEKTIIRGIEVRQTPWCWSNIACHSSVLKNNKMNENFPLAEDTELFARLNNLGYKGLELPIAPVLHERKSKGFWKSVNNSFAYGRLLVKINLKYNNIDFNPEKIKGSSIIKREIQEIFSRIAFLCGAIVGFIGHNLAGKKNDRKTNS
ncbi:MAG: glycosyltransferase [Candidatus Diapherotrites archaeon]